MKRYMTTMLVVLGVLGLVACGGKKSGDSKGGKGKGGKSGMGSGGGKKKLDKAGLEALIKVKVPGFKQLPGAKVNAVITPMTMVYFKGEKGNAKGMTAFAQVRMYACGHCPELSAAAFKKQRGLFEKMMNSKAHKENPKAVFEIKDATVAGKKVVTVYQLSFVVSADGKTRGSSHGYSIYHHDGKNMLHISVFPRGLKGFVSTKSLEQLKAQFTRAEMEAAGKLFLETLGAKMF